MDSISTAATSVSPTPSALDPKTVLAPTPALTGIPMPGPQTLRDTARRVFTFIIAIDRNAAIGLEMRKHGYRAADHEEGWRLLHKSGSHFQEDAVESPSEAALRELDAWDEVGFHKAHAALVRAFPSQADFIFKDLVPHQGADAILGIVQFLDRLDLLEQGRSDATKDADAAAMKELSDRGIGASERARLRALVQIAQSSPSTLVDEPEEVTADQRTQDLYALYCWYQRWVEIARAVIKNRKAAVTLGIAHRRQRTEIAAATSTTTGASPSAAQPPTAGAPAPTPTA